MWKNKEIVRTNLREIIIEAETAKEALDKLNIQYPEILLGVKPVEDKGYKKWLNSEILKIK